MSEPMLAAELDRRRAERVDVNYPIKFGAAEGVARGMSAGGLYFETESQVVVGQRLRIAMTISEAEGGTVTVRARVCRVDVLDDGLLGVAAILEGVTTASAHELRTEERHARMSKARAHYARIRSGE